MTKDTNTIITNAGQTYMVSTYRILGTNEYRIEVYEPTNLRDHKHTTLTLEFGKWWGSVTSRELPSDINAIPVGPVRWEAIAALRNERFNELASVVNVPDNATWDGHRFCYTQD